YTELQEGLLLVSPSPRAAHNIASGELFAQIRAQLPANLQVIQDIDIDLELVPEGDPGFVRRPDLIVVERAAVARSAAEDRVIRASEAVLVVEIVSPGSRRMDHVIKRGEYADAGIPHYWIIDLDTPVSVVVCHLAGEFGYQDSMTATGTVKITDPFDLTVDLDQLI
ncbi:MAG TPA: Uma2 family endonuclease, partial [Pseudonocardiaceae bacterium]